MDWQDWLEKDGKKDFAIRERNYEKLSTGGGKPDKSLLLNTDKPDKTIPQIKRDFVDDADDKEYKNASWEDWLEKVARNPMGLKGNRGYNTRLYEDPETHHVGIHDNKNDDAYEISGTGSGNTDSDMHKETKWNIDNEHFSPSKKPKGTSVSTKTASWELFLEKNNAIETSHKDGEKKHEWDGKFSSSTIRDDAKDEKAESEEESLEELTDGKLEEVEKLKSWEVFLKGQGGVESDVSPSPSEHIDMTGKNPTKRQRGHGVGTPQTVNGKTVPREVAQKPSGNVKTSRAGTFQDTKGTKNLTADDIEASAKRIGMITNNDLGAGTDKRVPTKEELEEKDAENWRNSPAGQAFHKRQQEKARKGLKIKSWEVWLEKDALDGKQSPDGLPKLTAGGKEVEIEVKNVIDRDNRGKKNEMYKSWLEKMQGAGDARFGNQHLTGLDQKPVDNEEDEANILPEKDEKRNEKDEKQDKTEDKEDKDNKPYKALGGE